MLKSQLIALPAEHETLFVASEDCEKLCKILEMYQSCDLETLDAIISTFLNHSLFDAN